jgi:flagellar hook-basal body complex protein FliE
MIEQINGVPTRSAAQGVAAPTSVARPAQTGSVGAFDGDFAALIGQAVAELAQNLRTAEAVSVAGIKGTASTQEVVETVMAAEQSLQAAIAVRDKIVAAYLEISRMAI